MRISRLRLLGFKSFVEPTELVIEPGLTGVVGPNGCGKSNLLEALRWVMGETSHKSMRAAAMDDVIFSGTSSRPARNLAEVTIFIDNSERLAPVEFNDSDTIEITRRIEREAGSAYRINGREARARDVKILFEDAATGSRSPALVRQGQIGDIVNAKPEARRRILEDAAGIAGLHSRRHEAELRLKAAENNLARLNDVLGGLNSQIESLKRQARQARRYRDLSREITRAEALLMHLTWRDAYAAAEAEEARLREVLVRLGEATRAEAASLRAEAEAAAQLLPLREADGKASALLARLRIEAENFEREAERQTTRASELEDRIAQLERDLAREEALKTEAVDTIARLEQEIDAIEGEETNAETSALSAEVDLKDAAAALEATEAELSRLTAAVAQERAQRDSAQSTLTQARQRVERVKTQLETLDRQASEIGGGGNDAADHERVLADVARLGELIADIEQRTSDAEMRHEGLAETVTERREAASQSRMTANALKTERETLARLLVPDSGDYPAIVDSVRVAPGFEAALGAALGDDLDAPADSAAAVHWLLIEGDDNDPPLPEGVDPLDAHVKAPPELQRRLRQIGVVASDAGADLQPYLRPGQRLVSREGDLWRWDGFVAASHGMTAAAQRLSQRNRLTALAQEETQAREQAERDAAAEVQAAALLRDVQGEEQRLRQDWRNAQNELSAAQATLQKIDRRRREIESKLAAIAGARTSSERDLEEAESRAAEAAAVAERFSDSAIAALEEERSAILVKAQGERAHVADLRASVAALTRARQERAHKRASLASDLERWRTRLAGSGEQMSALSGRRDEARVELETLAGLPAQIEARRQKLLDGLTEAERQQKEASDALQRGDAARTDAASALREAQGDVGAAREDRARIEAKLEAARNRCQEEAHRIHETFNVTPEACLSLAELGEGDALPALADVDRQWNRLKADRERLGGVNLQADEDLEQLSDQFTSMESERGDVEQAIAKLRGGIGQLNREGRKRLNEAFQTVDGHFQRLFGTLFGGGEARLEMVQSEDDPLEGGLEIIARPPGKKPATLSLLSGGEQTLTALSLIFAVFLTNPSPICVLDEVDAPLDDANVDRFCTLMEKMAEETATRFLVITHHPMTMTRMQRLFGVTMAEKGVSQLVSVDLQTAQEFREAS
ncbi:Chromosome partition protein Smc [Candidatus Filomicrobium marinum]|uniref:Chromosome partition protein Smc n=1 Tax=Candidatus Filomicrobium marinum TaxID=1608628 RepID=A0A0D6JKE9_9HYPH|nr:MULTISPECIES: chromosome segregation protein SMC [Filomicrobium]MCV0369129.1 chromosome segregation protein SMC [Filomicrobium sp.]CFX60908.1 Chromosome partition protein Smc [Candidatus Filomicrobium marinum]CPR22438.1 Chromosome partition protein Smc [Candidatus Filomicrobium marinum]